MPIELSSELLALDVVKSFQSLVTEGCLQKWELGRKGTHVSSHFVTACGLDDMLTSPFPNDNNFENLCKAHISRALEVLQGTAEF